LHHGRRFVSLNCGSISWKRKDDNKLKNHGGNQCITYNLNLTKINRAGICTTLFYSKISKKLPCNKDVVNTGRD